jgi:hypothetical protein
MPCGGVFASAAIYNTQEKALKEDEKHSDIFLNASDPIDVIYGSSILFSTSSLGLPLAGSSLPT